LKIIEVLRRNLDSKNQITTQDRFKLSISRIQLLRSRRLPTSFSTVSTHNGLAIVSGSFHAAQLHPTAKVDGGPLSFRDAAQHLERFPEGATETGAIQPVEDRSG
jgi:hypothetical protein